MTEHSDIYQRPTWLPEYLWPYWESTLRDLYRALIVGEAEGESWLGKLAVGYVARNRRRFSAMARLPWFSPTSDRQNVLARYQFSCFWSDYGRRERALSLSLHVASRYSEADAAACAVLDETEPDPTVGPEGVGADHYYAHNTMPEPSWAVPLFDGQGLVRPGFTRTVRLGAHTFYSSWV